MPLTRSTRLGVTVATAGLALAATAFGLGFLTGTAWVWWLAPLVFALDAFLLFRARARGEAPVLSPSGLRIFRDPGAPLYLVSSIVAAGVAAWGAYAENALAVVLAGAFAMLGRVFERGEEPAFKSDDTPANAAQESRVSDAEV